MQDQYSPLHASAMEVHTAHAQSVLTSSVSRRSEQAYYSNSIGAWPYSNACARLAVHRRGAMPTSAIGRSMQRSHMHTCAPIAASLLPYSLWLSLPFSAAHVYTATGSYRSQRPIWRISTYQELSRARVPAPRSA